MSTRLISYDPWSGAEVWSGSAADVAACGQAMEAAAAIQPVWAAKGVDERIRLLLAFADNVRDRRDELAELICRETGKALWDATSEAGAVVGKIDVSIRAWEERGETRRGEDKAVRSLPLGVMVVLGPFNFPAHLPNGQIIPGLLAGNTVVFKPSEHTPAVGEWLVQRLHEAGVPQAAVGLVQGGRAVAEALVDHPKTAAVWLTGSRQAGVAIHKRLAGRPEILLALELGGNNPLILWDATDEEALVRLAMQSTYISSGQRCTCARRIIVPDDKRGHKIIDALVAGMERLRWGNPTGDPQPFGGPLIHAAAAERVQATQQTWLDAGAKQVVACGGGEPAALVTAGLWDCTGCSVADEECFGPLAQIHRVKNIDAAIACANATRYGLAAAVVTENDGTWEKCQRDLRAGVVNRNKPTTGASGLLPFGGIGWSGNHRPAGYRVIDACIDPIAELTSYELDISLPTGMRAS